MLYFGYMNARIVFMQIFAHRVGAASDANVSTVQWYPIRLSPYGQAGQLPIVVRDHIID